jgi:hypothetical protein
MAPPVLERLKYVSRFARPLSASGIEEIVRRAAANNERVGVTGVMLAHGDVFMQILEGPPEAVDRTFARIERDDRHVDIVVLRRTSSTARLFGDWSMRLLDLGADARRQVAPLIAMIRAYGRGDRAAVGTLFELDDAVWRALGSRANGAAPSGSRAVETG